MNKLVLQIFLVIIACLPLIVLVLDMAQRYAPDSPLRDIGLTDALLLLVALALPVVVLSRLGVDWRTGPEEY